MFHSKIPGREKKRPKKQKVGPNNPDWGLVEVARKFYPGRLYQLSDNSYRSIAFRQTNHTGFFRLSTLQDIFLFVKVVRSLYKNKKNKEYFHFHFVRGDEIGYIVLTEEEAVTNLKLISFDS